MKSLGFIALLALGGLMVTPLIHADVSDSGNLSIGGNGIIYDSMTVIGPIAGSSVTLSSSGAGAYDLTSSTGIHVLSGQIKLESGAYIKWADGSTSTTASAGGGAVALPTRQILKSGTVAVYTAPAGARQLRIRMVGGGGEGAANTGAGNNGSSTTWITAGSTIAAYGGLAANPNQSFTASGGTGGTGGSGVFASSSVFRAPGSPGHYYSSTSN